MTLYSVSRIWDSGYNVDNGDNNGTSPNVENVAGGNSGDHDTSGDDSAIVHWVCTAISKSVSPLKSVIFTIVDREW